MNIFSSTDIQYMKLRKAKRPSPKNPNASQAMIVDGGSCNSLCKAAEVEFWRFLAKSVQSSKRILHSLTILHNELSVKTGGKSVPARKMAMLPKL